MLNQGSGVHFPISTILKPTIFLKIVYCLFIIVLFHSTILNVCLFVCFRGSKALNIRKHGFSIDFCATFHSLNAVLKSEKGYNFQGVKFLSSSFLHRIYFHNGQPRIFQKRACHTTSVKLETKKAVMAKISQ